MVVGFMRQVVGLEAIARFIACVTPRLVTPLAHLHRITLLAQRLIARVTVRHMPARFAQRLVALVTRGYVATLPTQRLVALIAGRHVFELAHVVLSHLPHVPIGSQRSHTCLSQPSQYMTMAHLHPGQYDLQHFYEEIEKQNTVSELYNWSINS